MLAGGGIGPFAGLSLGRVPEPHEHRAAGRVADIANLPVIALAATVGEIMAAHYLSLPDEAVCQIGGVGTGHYAASRSEIRASG